MIANRGRCQPILKTRTNIVETARHPRDQSSNTAKTTQCEIESERSHRQCPRQRAGDGANLVDPPTPALKLANQTIPGPAPKISRMRMIEPGAMSGQNHSTLLPDKATHLAQIPVEIPHVLEHLKRHAKAETARRESEPAPRFESHIGATGFDVCPHVVVASASEQRFVRSITAAQIDHSVPNRTEFTECRFDRGAQLTHQIPVRAPHRRVETKVLAPTGQGPF